MSLLLLLLLLFTVVVIGIDTMSLLSLLCHFVIATAAILSLPIVIIVILSSFYSHTAWSPPDAAPSTPPHDAASASSHAWDASWGTTDAPPATSLHAELPRCPSPWWLDGSASKEATPGERGVDSRAGVHQCSSCEFAGDKLGTTVA